MGRAIEHPIGAGQFDVTVESLYDDIAYYKAMLAEASRNMRTTRICATPEILRKRLGECEQLLAQMQRRR